MDFAFNFGADTNIHRSEINFKHYGQYQKYHWNDDHNFVLF